MMERLQQAAAWLMNRVRVNRLQADVHDGAPVFVKRRRAGAPIVIWFANRFLALARSGTCMFVRADDWIEWEVHCAQLLYPGRQAVKVGPGPAVVLPRVDGTSLRTMLHRDGPDVRTALVLAARELRRVHQIECSRYNAGWSHGDLHLDNIVCDVTAERAVLIDFDTRHEFGLGPVLRHSDDVKVVLLELMGLSDDRWQALATAFVQAYRESSALNELSRQLVVPRGIARVLWYIRTNGCSIERSESRVQSLREIIHSVTSGNHD